MTSPASNYQKVTHCIFDMDGLLLDTEKLYTQATQKILDKYGKTYTWEVKASVMGLQTQGVSEKIVANYDLPITWQEYARLQREGTEVLMPHAEFMPDTENVYEEITRQIANEYDKPYLREIRFKLLGTTERRTAEIAVDGLGLPITADEFLHTFHEMGRKLLGDCALMKGAERLLRHLHSHNIPIALATSSSEPMFKLKIAKHREVFDLFHHIVCGSTDPEVKEGKPAPDIFLICASRFPDKPDSSVCLVFEDAPNGVRAAKLAGMQRVMVPDERLSAELREEATLVLKSLLDFKPEEFGLPPFADDAGN